jgi:hypothetical protein
MLSEAQKRAAAKWQKENTYKKTIQFYKKDVPEEIYEKAMKEIQLLYESQNKFFAEKIKEMAKLYDERVGK